MNQKSGSSKASADKLVKNIRRKTRQTYSAEEKIRIVLAGIPDDRHDDLIEFALEYEALTTRELAVKYTDEKRYFISESSAYRILKEADLITAPDYVVIKAADEFTDKTTAINEMWQTDFTYFKIIGWGWYLY